MAVSAVPVTVILLILLGGNIRGHRASDHKWLSELCVRTSSWVVAPKQKLAPEYRYQERLHAIYTVVVALDWMRKVNERRGKSLDIFLGGSSS